MVQRKRWYIRFVCAPRWNAEALMRSNWNGRHSLAITLIVSAEVKWSRAPDFILLLSHFRLNFQTERNTHYDGSECTTEKTSRVFQQFQTSKHRFSHYSDALRMRHYLLSSKSSFGIHIWRIHNFPIRKHAPKASVEFDGNGRSIVETIYLQFIHK